MSERGPAIAGSLCPAGAWVALLLVCGGAASGAELWREEIDFELCRVVLISEATDVRASTSSRRNEITVEGDSSTLAIEPSRDGANLTLRVEGASDGDGEIEVRLPPACSAEIKTGSGTVSVDGGKEGLSYSVSTVTGAVEALVDPDSSTAVELATSGEITTDYSIRIDYVYRQEPSKHGSLIVEGNRDTGTDRVFLTSLRGAISVLRRPDGPPGETPQNRHP